MNKIIKKQKPKNNKTNKKTEITTIKNTMEKEITPIPKKKNHLLKNIAYLTIILQFFLYIIVICYENKIPCLTRGIDNFINLTKSIIPGGQK